MLARGDIPCDILFIGEAPGPSEDVIGVPFVGPAGKLLDQIIVQGVGNPSWRIAFTNLVCCIPLNEAKNKFNEPPKYAIDSCEDRLVEFVQLCKPKLIVLVGKLAKKHVPGQAMFGDGPENEYKQKPCTWLEADEYLEFCEITHPAAILRADQTQQGLLVQRCIVALNEAVGRLVPF